MDLTLSNGNSFSDGQSMSASEGTEREAPFWRWLMRAAEDRRLVDGPQWRKSSLSGYNNSCVEVADSPHGTVLVRNSRFPHQVPLEFTSAEWAAFLGGVRLGEFDRSGS